MTAKRVDREGELADGRGQAAGLDCAASEKSCETGDPTIDQPLSAVGKQLLEPLFGETEALKLTLADANCLASLLYELRYHQTLPGRRRMSQQQFEIRVFARLQGMSIKQIAELCQASAPGVSVFFTRLTETILADTDLTLSDRRALVDEALSGDREARLAGNPAVSLAEKIDSLAATPAAAQAGSTPQESGDDSGAAYLNLRSQLNQILRRRGRADLLDLVLSDETLRDIGRRVIAAHNPGLNAYSYVNQYFEGGLNLKHPIHRHVHHNLAFWVADGLAGAKD